MKTPDDIKKGLQYCSEKHESCKGCTYLNEEDYEIECLNAIMVDALAYIRLLENGIDHAEKVAKEAVKTITENLDKLETHLAQAERERDAAVIDLSDSCKFCNFAKQGLEKAPCDKCFQRVGKYPWSPMVRTRFEWRGVCDENTKVGVNV